jgi:hypothetical protein
MPVIARRLATLATAGLVALGLSTAPAAAGAGGRYHGDVAGAVTGPGHQFFVGDGLELEFLDRTGANTVYDVCYRGGQGRRCLRRTTGAAGRKSRIFFAAKHTGRYRATWYVAGKPVAHWSWRNHIGD